MDARTPEPAVARRGPLSSWMVALFSGAAIPVAGLATPLSVYLPNYYASHLGLPLAAVGAVCALVRLLDLAFDLLIGVSINATSTRIGRFRPWMLAGVPVLMFAVYAIFMAEPGVKAGYLAAWLLVLYAGYSMLT